MRTKPEKAKRAVRDRLRSRFRALARRLAVGAAAFAVVPFAVEVDPVDRDTSFTTFTLGAGAGSYADVRRGCNGVISSTSRPVSDVGFGMEHRTGSAALGVRVSQVREGRDGSSSPLLVNPHVAYEGGSFGSGAGIIIPFDDDRASYGNEEFLSLLLEPQFILGLPFTGHVRLGNAAAGKDFAIRFGESVPISTPGGAFEMSQGFRISRRVGARFGVAGPGPFDSVGLLVRAKVDASDAFAIELRGRIGSSAGERESTIGVGLSYRVRHD